MDMSQLKMFTISISKTQATTNSFLLVNVKKLCKHGLLKEALYFVSITDNPIYYSTYAYLLEKLTQLVRVPSSTNICHCSIYDCRFSCITTFIYTW